ncbi:MAG: hypothetical protein ACOYK9_02450 [Chlamydiia bacterium]
MYTALSTVGGYLAMPVTAPVSAATNAMTRAGAALNETLVQTYAGVAPTELRQLLEVANNVHSSVDFQIFGERAKAIRRNSDLSAFHAKIDEWIQLIDDSSETNYQGALPTLQKEIKALVDLQTGMLGHTFAHAGHLASDVLRTAPSSIQEARSLIEKNQLHKEISFDTLITTLQAIADLGTLTTEEKEFLAATIASLKEPEEIDWLKLDACLRQINEKHSGPICKNVDQIGIRASNTTKNILGIFRENLFSHGHPIYTQIYDCNTLIHQVLREATEIVIPAELAERLRSLLSVLGDHANPSLLPLLQEFDQEVCALLEPPLEERVESPSYRQDIERKRLIKISNQLQKLSNFFSPPGSIVQVGNFVSTWLSKNGAIFSRMRIPYNYSDSNLQALKHRQVQAIRFEEVESPPVSPLTETAPPKLSILKISAAANQEARKGSRNFNLFLDEIKARSLIGFAKWISVIPEDFQPSKVERANLRNVLLASLSVGGFRPVPSLKCLAIKLYDKTATFLLDHFLKTLVLAIEAKAVAIVTSKKLDTTPLAKLTKSLKQLSIDLKNYHAADSTLSRSEYLENLRKSRDTSCISSISLSWRLSPLFAKKITENFRLEWIIEDLFSHVKIPILGLDLAKVASTCLSPINYIVRKFLQFTLRLFISLFPIKQFSEKALDAFLTTENLENCYRKALESLLEGYRNQIRSNFDASLGKRVDRKIAKDLFISLIGTLQNHEGIDAQSLHTDHLKYVPALLKSRLFDIGAEGVACAYDNVLHIKTLKSIQNEADAYFFKEANKTEQASSNPYEPQPLSFPDIEHALSMNIIKDLKEQNKASLLENRLLQLKSLVARLPNPASREDFIVALKSLRTELANSRDKRVPDISSKTEGTINGYVARLLSLASATTGPLDEINTIVAEFKNAVDELQVEEMEKTNVPRAIEDIPPKVIMESLNTILLAVREIATDKELVKRIILDQLYAS